MSHHRYQTEAVILGSVPRGESDRVFFLFTKDMGLIPASAQGIRNLPSKLRYTLSDFGALEVDLIRMEDMWRIVDAEERPIIFSAPHSDALRAFVRIAGLLRRLMRGERKEAVLFDGCMQFRNFLLTEKLLPKECRDAEIAMAVKVLHELGYGGESRESKTVSSESFSRELISFVAAHRHTLVSFTNARLNESHL